MTAEPLLVGIVNVTPDSFSDGGRFSALDEIWSAIGQLIDDGAGVIDIGAESTRPGATPVSADMEWQRLSPVLAGLSRFTGRAQFSVDTRHPETAKKALAAGADWINDVSGFTDPAMVNAVKDSSCKLVVMHSLGVPADKQKVMVCDDVVKDIIVFGHERIAALQKAGIHRSRIIFDPGIGFGKTAQQSMTLVRRVAEFRELGVPLYVGHSRKSFLKEIAGSTDPDEATVNVSSFLAQQGVEYLRVHNVAKNRMALQSLQLRENYGR